MSRLFSPSLPPPSPPSSLSQGVMSRVYETVLILLLLCVLVFGLSWLLLDHDTSWVRDPHEDLLCVLLTETCSSQDSWFLYLPLLYSVMSLLGVVVMGICTPLGVSHLFTVLGALITSPKVDRQTDRWTDSVLVSPCSPLLMWRKNWRK